MSSYRRHSPARRSRTAGQLHFTPPDAATGPHPAISEEIPAPAIGSGADPERLSLPTLIPPVPAVSGAASPPAGIVVLTGLAAFGLLFTFIMLLFSL